MCHVLVFHFIYSHFLSLIDTATSKKIVIFKIAAAALPYQYQLIINKLEFLVNCWVFVIPFFVHELGYNGTILDIQGRYIVVLPHYYGTSIRRLPRKLKTGKGISTHQC